MKQIATIIGFLLALTFGPAAQAGGGKVAVVAAENFYGDVARQIGGDRVAVTSIMNNPDQDPHLFETTPTTVRQIGAAKPHPRCFQHLARDLRLEPRNILYVGDDPVLDVEAARAAGLRTAWMNRSRVPWPAHLPRADVDVADCRQLADLLALGSPRCQS